MIYQNILRLCQERGITIRQLEEQSGVGNGIVHNWKTRSVPKVDKLKKVADYLNVTLDELVSEPEKATRGIILLRIGKATVLRDDFHSARELCRKVRDYCYDGDGWTVKLEMGQTV